MYVLYIMIYKKSAQGFRTNIRALQAPKLLLTRSYCVYDRRILSLRNPSEKAQKTLNSIESKSDDRLYQRMLWQD